MDFSGLTKTAYNTAIDPGGTTGNLEDLKGTEHTPPWEAIKKRYRIFVYRWHDHRGIMMRDLVNDCKKTVPGRRRCMRSCVNGILTIKSGQGRVDTRSMEGGYPRHKIQLFSFDIGIFDIGIADHVRDHHLHIFGMTVML